MIPSELGTPDAANFHTRGKSLEEINRKPGLN
jgi:hypothetical protein